MILLLIVCYLFIGLSVWGMTNELDDILGDDYYIATLVFYLLFWPVVIFKETPNLYRKIAGIFIDKRA